MLQLQFDKVVVREFTEDDIPNKIKWINDPENNTYLHYDLPLEYDKTLLWFERIRENETRLDAVIEYKGIPVGLIGLLCIDKKNLKAEFYICMGESAYKGKGIAKSASNLLINYTFDVLKLNKIYLYTEQENIPAQKLFEKLGFKKEGLLEQDLIYNGRKVNRYTYGILKEDACRC